MENNTEIANELREISPNTAVIGNKNVFFVPAGYFEDLPRLILERVKNEPPLQAADTASPGYLFPDGLNFNNLHKIPEDYFQEFPEKLMSRIRESEQDLAITGEDEGEFPLLNRIDRKMPFSVPPAYFEGLTGQLFAGAQAIDGGYGKETPLLVQGVENKTPYAVPEGYFDQFAGSVLDRVKKVPLARVVSLRRKNWVRYAAAAVVIGVIGGAGLLFFNKQITLKHVDPIQNLSEVSEQEMMNYLENQGSPTVAVDTTNSFASIDLNNDTDPKDLLNDIPDNELQQYIDEHVSAKDLIIN